MITMDIKHNPWLNDQNMDIKHINHSIMKISMVNIQVWRRSIDALEAAESEDSAHGFNARKGGGFGADFMAISWRKDGNMMQKLLKSLVSGLFSWPSHDSQLRK